MKTPYQTHVPKSKSSQNQRGFGAAGILAVVVILGVVGFTGWFVYKTKQDTDKTLNQSAATSTTSDTSAAAAKKDGTIHKTVLSKAPKSLLTAVVAETTAKAPTCVKGGAIVDVDGKPTDQEVTYSGAFAQTAVGCDGAAATLFANTGKAWAPVGSTQFLYKCADLKQHKVTVAFLQAVSTDPTQPVKCLPADPNAQPETYKL